MRFTSHFGAFSTLLSAAAAIPVAQASSIRSPTTSKPVIPSASTPYISQSPTPSMLALVGAYECPPSQQKQCCQSLEQTSKDIMEGLGELVPILGGIQISSKMVFQCKNMAPDESPDSCDDKESSPMCCSSGSSNSVGACKPFAEAKEAYYRSFGYGQESQVDYINDAVD
ncbi:uncharacterized protein N7498_010557 [Penicillium cinerascens]|uniref:Hydrophobin n=1 Tax=Penicillium cinerascens TaxID=70096 RepID=A0A9W9M910_9EURO|nr:uncharacterized protein N7498_010557 [Penicillium cinerascens]KAJ5191572.1 hypothetical protein N7498_010557 [Penicillium cinerascens]